MLQLKVRSYGILSLTASLISLSITLSRKDTRTKSRGRVEVGEGGGTGWSGVEGRGENANNLTE